MSAHRYQSKYGFSRTINLSFEEAIVKARAALKKEGFGVISMIDIDLR